MENNCSKDQAVQIPNKKCGSLGSILIKELPEKEVIHCIYLASSKQHDQKKDQMDARFILTATLSCQVYLINLLTQETVIKFDLSAYRFHQFENHTGNVYS